MKIKKVHFILIITIAVVIAFNIFLFMSAPKVNDSDIQQKQFVDCLTEKNVKIYIDDGEDSYFQIEPFQKYASQVTVDCAAETETCLAAGVKDAPAVVFNDIVYPGYKYAKWFDNVVGCKY